MGPEGPASSVMPTTLRPKVDHPGGIAVTRRSRGSRLGPYPLGNQLHLILRPRDERWNIHLPGRDDPRFSGRLRGRIPGPCCFAELADRLPDDVAFERLHL